MWYLENLINDQILRATVPSFERLLHFSKTTRIPRILIHDNFITFPSFLLTD